MVTAMLKDRVTIALSGLLGKPLCGSERILFLQRFDIGPCQKIPRLALSSGTDDYRLIIGCMWRISCAGRILVASGDRYHPREDVLENLDPCHYEKPGTTLLDTKMERFLKEECPLHVIEIGADDVGGFRLNLEKGFVLDVFPHNSSEEEHWRLTRSGGADAEEIVLSGRKLEWKTKRAGGNGSRNGRTEENGRDSV